MVETKEKCIFIIVNGGTASGKTTVCRSIIKGLDDFSVSILSMDNFYKTPTQDQMKSIADYNFDHPDAFDWDLMLEKLKDIKNRRETEVPIYEFCTHSRKPETLKMTPADVVIFEGILAAYDPRIRALSDLTVFVDTDSDLRVLRRITRDMAERGRSLESVIQQYKKSVKPSFDLFCAPLKRYSHMILPHGEYNPAAINLLRGHVSEMLRMKSGKCVKKIQVQEMRDDVMDYCLFEH